MYLLNYLLNSIIYKKKWIPRGYLCIHTLCGLSIFKIKGKKKFCSVHIKNVLKMNFSKSVCTLRGTHYKVHTMCTTHTMCE